MSKFLMVGYLESWAPAGITFTQAAEVGYDTIVMAFGTINGTSIGIADGEFNPSPTTDALKKDISNAKTKGAKHILFSVGGEKNTYNPENAPVEDVAESIVHYLNEYGFTGIDFDLEIDTDADYLDQLCAAIRQLQSSLLITAAPQLNQNDHASNLFLVSTGNFQTYKKAVENKRFDYLFIQAYNNEWPKVDSYSEMDVSFISAAFKNLKNSIPDETMITIGEPASIDAAGVNSIFYGPDAGTDIYELMAEQYKSIRDDVQFGGVMTWDVNWDEKNGYQLVNTMKNITE
jgi:chitinase